MTPSTVSFRRFMLLWSGQLISAIGGGLTAFGLGVYVYKQTGMASATALVTLLAFLPCMLLAPFAGILADRFDRRLLMVLGDGLSAVGLVFILLCMRHQNAQLWQICLGVTVSSVFSSLLEPAYRATVTDLLTREQYAKASGLVQAAGSAKYLVSPLLAGFLLQASDIRLLLLIDICTLAVTVTTTLVVRKGLDTAQIVAAPNTFAVMLKEGWEAVSHNKGVLILVVMSSLITFFIGFIQTLSAPLILSFADSATLGTSETICALGMLAASVLIGVFSIRSRYVKLLAGSLFCTGVFMVLFGLRENIVLICVSGFLFFATLPIANTCLDYLIRSNVANERQGRAWGFIGLISQLGYVAAYALSGVLTDYVFGPMMVQDGMLADSVGRLMGTGSGRGAALLIVIAGLMLSVIAAILGAIKPVAALEHTTATLPSP